MNAGSAASSHDGERGWGRLLMDPVFGPFLYAKTLSTMGIWIHNVVGAILVYEMSGSALAVGAVSVAQFAPQIILAPAFGAAADRGNRKKQVVLGRIVTGIGSGSLAVTLAFVGVEGLPGPWVVVAAALVVGIGFVIGGPAMLALVPSMVRPNELASAVALNSVPPSLARAAGPAVGAILATSMSPAVAFGLASVLHLAFALVVSFLRFADARPAQGQRSQIADAADLRRDRAVILLLIGVAAIGFGADPAITLTPPLADAFGGGAALVGTFASAFGVGAAVGLPLFSVLRRHLGLVWMGTLGLGSMALGNTMAGASGSREFTVAAFGIAGMGMSLAVSGLTTQLHERVSDEVRGRTMGLWSVAFLGTRPVAAAFNGAVTDATNYTVAFLAVAGLVGTAAYLVRPRAVT